MPKLLYPEEGPECGHRLSRSRRRGWIERMVTRFLKIRVFRCQRCQTRFYSPPALIFHARDVEEQVPDHDKAFPKAGVVPTAEANNAEMKLDEAVLVKFPIRLPLGLPASGPSSATPSGGKRQTWTQQTSSCGLPGSSTHGMGSSTPIV